MNKYLKNSLYIFLSITLVVFIFGTGFYFGGLRFGFSGQARASETADLAPFWTVWNILDEKFVGAATTTTKVSSEEKVYGAIEGLVASYGDPYTVFFTPDKNKKFNETIQGNFEGVGMEIDRKDNILTVVAPIKDSPAEKAGVRPGDIIIEIDKKSTKDLSLEEAVGLIRGKLGTKVEILVVREDESEPITFSIPRAVINIPVLETELRKDGIFVISLFNFSAKSETEFRKALRQFILSKSNKLILDLRGNPGGFLDSAIDVSSWFLPAGKTVVSEHFGENKEDKVFRSKGYNIFNGNLKMVVLIDKGSASASEIVAGALKSHGIAKLVGTSTFGKGSVQELIDITPETSLKVTIAQWLTPDGVSISKGGLAPDFEVQISKEDIEENKDPQLEKAVEILLKK